MHDGDAIDDSASTGKLERRWYRGVLSALSAEVFMGNRRRCLLDVGLVLVLLLPKYHSSKKVARRDGIF